MTDVGYHTEEKSQTQKETATNKIRAKIFNSGREPIYGQKRQLDNLLY